MSVPLLKPYYLHLLQDGSDPAAALQYLLYVNQCPRNAVDLLNRSAETLSMCLKKLTVRLFCVDLSKQDFVSCYRFLVETQSMFSRLEDGRRLTYVFKIIEDIEVILRGIAMNFRQPSTAGPLEAAKMLAFLGDTDFVRNIFSYLTSYQSDSPNKALIFLNLSPLLVHYMNFCEDLSAVHARIREAFAALVSDRLEQAAVVRNAEILLQSLEFYQHERKHPLVGPLLDVLRQMLEQEGFDALGLTLQNVVFT